MSLRAKLEAVIYAAEEPVTLSQLAALFSADALEWTAAQAAAAAEQAAEVAGQPLENAAPELLLGVSLEYLGLGIVPEVTAMEPAEQAEPAAEIAPEVEGAPAVESAPDAEVPAEPEAGVPPDAESEMRRPARQRDREIRGVIKQLLDELIVTYASDDRGIEIREIAGGYRMATKPECHDAVRAFVKSLKPPLKLSLPALETLAVVAYKQPVTAPEVNEIRGVESGGVLGSLLARKLIATAGRKQVIGRPILYKTTKEFLLRFGLKDLAELPSMEEFEKMAAAEIEEMEPEAAAADAAEETAGGLLEEAAEMGDENGTAVMEDNSLGSEDKTPEIPENAEPSEAATEVMAGLSAEPGEPSNQQQATPVEMTPAENETVPHAQEEEDER